ncbi:response regulator [Pontibacter sp. SGAir0037]|uniref:response regulator n=1 Tax=Pontibacter sp. SGAir0037 TaxID=2571030 RepID=UPI0010CD5350|nr:response regulator [Pontibacter sp. SGAir0037]QCR22511.1 hypothetical protein C1N53_09295 [Pontibacter sp. SGAir0037]
MIFFRQLIDVNPFPIYLKNEQGKFVFANKAYADVQAIELDELITTGYCESDFSYERDLEVIRSGVPVTIQEFYKSDTGGFKWYNTVKMAYQQTDGSVYLLSISSDITDFKEKILNDSDLSEEKEQIFVDLCREIRTPVYSIIELAKQIRHTNLSKYQEEKLNSVLTVTDNILATLNQALEYNELEKSNEVELEFISFSPVTILRDTVNALISKAKEQGIRLEFRLNHTKELLVQGDPFRLSQILLILINNAIKYTYEGNITVSLKTKEKSESSVYIEFCVEDTGIGMNEEKAATLFLQEEPPNTGDSPGFGLKICKRLIESQGGMLWFDSVPGLGSRFYFTIPYITSNQYTEKHQPEAVLSQNDLKGLNLLLAEDNHVNQLIAISHLEAWDVLVELAFDGEEALKKATDKKYDLILMDIQLPKMDGIEVTNYLRSEPNPNQETPIIAFTANTIQQEPEKFRSLGFNYSIFKPYQTNDLHKIIADNTGRNRAYTSIATASHGKGNKLYDFSGLGSLADDFQFIQKMQRLFIETVPDQLSEIRAAIKQEKWDAVAQMAHRLKSTYSNIKVKEATENLKNIERFANARSSTDKIENLLFKVMDVTDQILNAFLLELTKEEY